jgi:hypothetical protein
MSFVDFIAEVFGGFVELHVIWRRQGRSLLLCKSSHPSGRGTRPIPGGYTRPLATNLRKPTGPSQSSSKACQERTSTLEFAECLIVIPGREVLSNEEMVAQRHILVEQVWLITKTFIALWDLSKAASIALKYLVNPDASLILLSPQHTNIAERKSHYLSSVSALQLWSISSTSPSTGR